MNDMKKYHSWMWGVVLALFLIAAFIGPVIINWLYKIGPGWVTMWEAPDMLSYYGTILGAAVTAFSLILTIAFTRKQIARARFLEGNRDKWEKVDSIITKTLVDVSPLNLCNSEKLDGSISSNLQTIILSLQSYAITAKTSLNMAKCYIGPSDYEKIGHFIRILQDAIEQFCAIENDLVNEYLTLQTIALKNDGSVPRPELLAHLDRTTEINKRIPPAHDGIYQSLFNMKREVFEKIYTDIDEQAAKMLLFVWRKPHAHS